MPNVDISSPAKACQHYAKRARDAGVPEHLVDGLALYIVMGCPTGSFLEAVLANSLRGAFMRGDSDSLAGLGRLVSWLYNDAPSACWGTPEKVEEWLDTGGLVGRLGLPGGDA